MAISKPHGRYTATIDPHKNCSYVGRCVANFLNPWTPACDLQPRPEVGQNPHPTPEYYANDVDQYPRPGGPHPTPECAEFMRSVLLDDIENVRDGDAFVASQWYKVAQDAGVRIPPEPDELAVGQFLDKIKRQVRRGSPSEVAAYYRQKGHTECMTCGAHWPPAQAQAVDRVSEDLGETCPVCGSSDIEVIDGDVGCNTCGAC